MSNRDRRIVRSLLAVAGLAVAVALPLQSALARDDGQNTPATPTTSSASEVLQQATDLLAEGKVVRARTMLTPLTGRAGAGLSDAERDRVYTLLNAARQRIQGLGPVETSLQSAEDALLRDDLINAERHANAVVAAPKGTNEQTARAKSYLERAGARREELAPTLAQRLTEIEGEFEEGRLAEARSGVEQVIRWGVTPDEALAQRLASMQTRVLSASEPANAGMLQPGVIKKREQPEPQPAQPEPAKQPEPSPQPAAQPAQPEPAAQPAAQPPEPPPAPQPDIITEAKKFEAQSIIAEADYAFEQMMLTDAAAKYNRALRVYGDVLTAEQKAHVEQRLAEVQARNTVNPGQPGRQLEDWINTTKIAHDQALAEFNNYMEQARKALNSGQPDEARNLAAAANLRLNSARQFMAQTEFEDLSKQLSAIRTEIDQREEAIRTEQARKREDDLKQQAAEQAAIAGRNKEEKIAQAIDRARALQREMKYEEALQVIDQVLFLDPVNPSAQLLRDVYQDIILAQRAYKYIDRRQRGIAQHGVENLEAIIPPAELLQYPEDWPAISNLRGEPVAFADTEDNRRALAVLENKRIPVEFNDTPFSSVLGFLQSVTQLNMDVDYASLETAGIDQEAQISMKISNASVRTVLDRVLEKVSADASDGAAWSVQDGILVVAPKSVINRNKALVIYDIRDLLVEVPDYNQAPEFDLQSVLQNTGQQGGGGGQSPFRDQGNQQGQAGAGRRTLEERTNELINIITTNVDSAGWQENGGDTGYIQQLQGNLIITQTAANHREIHGLLKKLRETRAMQINVETRFLLVSQDFFEEVGVDIDVYFNGRNNQVRTARANNPGGSIMPSDFFDFSQTSAVNAGTAGSAATPFINNSMYRSITGANGTSNVAPLPSPLSVIGAGQNSMGLAESLLQSTFGQDILSGAPALGVAGQFLDDLQVDFLVRATQADRRTVTLTAPRLTFTNGQTSNIYVATQVAFVSDLTPVVSESAVGFDPQLNSIPEGVRLLIDGTISSDRRYVTLNVDAAVSKIEGFTNTPVTAVAGGQLVNSAATQSFIQRPTVTVTRVQTTVTVPDQGTILLGGQRLVTESESESGVPVLSKIPIINRFFSNRVMAREEQTLLILLKPTILIQNEQEERHFPGLNDTMRFGG